jgi:rod shape determining protein RodA
MGRLRETFARADLLFLFSVITLVAFGLLAIYSIALSNPASYFSLVRKQLVATVIGSAAFVFAAVANYRLLRGYRWPLYALSILGLVAVLFFGVTVRGTTGWFAIGGFHFQPVEFAKLALAVVLAQELSDRAGRVVPLKTCLVTGLFTLVPVTLTLLQPDLGSALMLLGTWVAILLFAGLKRRYVFSFFALAGAAAAAAWRFFLADFQRARLLTFFDPTNDPLGEGYNVRQAIIGIGSGGWFGRGLGFGSQSQLKFIPESQTDFIFAVVAEELGFVGVVLLLFAFFVLFQRLLYHARRAPDTFTSFLILAIGISLFLPFVVNIGMNLGLLPVTGVALPLVSYGGSALIVTLTMLGVVASAIARMAGQRRAEFDRSRGAGETRR